jgi:hypothetical protein
MARDQDKAVAAGMLMSLDDTEYPVDGNSTEPAGVQGNLTRTEAILEECARYEEHARYQRVARAVAARREEERMENWDVGCGYSLGLCRCSCKTQKDDREALAKMLM